MAAKKPKPTPIEREINLRRRRIRNSHKRIADLQCKCVNEVNEIKAKMDRDGAVYDALVKSQKTTPRN